MADVVSQARCPVKECLVKHINVGVHIDHVTMTAHYTSCKQASER